MDKSKIVFGILGGIVFSNQVHEPLHVPDASMLPATQQSVHALPLYYQAHGNEPQDPSGPLREPWATVAVTTSTTFVTGASTPTVWGGSRS